MPSFTIVEVPFHMGLEGVAVGRGPARIVAAGADRVLADGSQPAEVVHVRKRDASAQDLDAVVDLNRQVRYAVRDTIARGGFPVVVAGNCNSCIGTLAGMGSAIKGIVWFDAHGDFNTPETSLSGSLEGMSLSVAVGQCHDGLRQRIGYTDPVPEEAVLLLGTRALESEEAKRLKRSQVHVAPGAEPAQLQRLRDRATSFYLHLDLDVLNPSESPGGTFRRPALRGTAV
jgi:arginase